MKRAGLVGACALTAILITEAAVVRILVREADAAPLPDRLLAVLIATALLLGALLALPRSAGVAWAAVMIASAISTIEVIAVIRTLESVATQSAQRDLTMLAGGSLVAGTSIGVAYAARGWSGASRASRAAVVALCAGLLATAVAAGWAVAGVGQMASGAELSPLRIAVRIGLATIATGFLVGAARDLGPSVARALRMSRGEPASGRTWRFAALLMDDLLPGRAADRRLAAEAERARLAADLHALVLPDLRHAAASAAAAGLPAEAQIDLRRALEDVEQLMHERQSVVLEQFGLVAALEWLAEQTEERSALRVELELEGDVPDRPYGLDSTVARAVFRIALLALDNVVRHSDASTATLRLSVDRDLLKLAVVDTGTGASGAPRSSGRGLGDMRAEAAASGGSIEMSFGQGARIEAAWLARTITRNHAKQPAKLTDRSRHRGG